MRINEKLGITAQPERDIPAVLVKKSRGLLKDGVPAPHREAILLTGPAHTTPGIPDGSVALVVTSPPFLDIVQYATDNWLRCWFSGIDPNGVALAMHRTETAWQAMVRTVLIEQARILRPGGHVAFEVGEVRKGKVLLERLVWAAAEGLPFERLGVMINNQTFTKTANCWGVDNGTKGTNTNRIVLLRRTYYYSCICDGDMTLSWAGQVWERVDVCCGLVGLAGGMGTRTGRPEGADRTCVWQGRNTGDRRCLPRWLAVRGRAQDRLASGRAGGSGPALPHAVAAGAQPLGGGDPARSRPR